MTTPEQARDFAQSIFDDGAPDDEVELIRSLADQVEALTAERDAYVKSIAVWEQSYTLSAEQHKIERDALKAELARPESTAVSLMRAENLALSRQVEELTPDALAYRDFMAALARGEDRS